MPASRSSRSVTDSSSHDARRVAAEPSTTAAEAGYRATVWEYLPNRVTVWVRSGAPGYLVLTDPWYPGWEATVDGEPAPLYRANYLFRAVPVPAGHHEVVFTFAPPPYLLGRRVSLVALALTAAALALGGAISWRRAALGHQGVDTPARP